MADSVADIKSIFGRALEFATAAERSAYLAEACQGDPRLRAEVESLLQAQQQAAGFFQGFGPLPGATAAEPPVAEQPGTVIGPYTLREQIGEGGFGLVFVAEQTQPVRRKVALKVIKPGMDTRQVIARFEAERQALAIMDHPNIARVLDGGATESGRPYFVMELVKGVPITQFCDEQRLTPRQRLELFVDVCSAVQHAHHKGIIHRDLKPSNVLVTSHDGKPVVKVIDFGVAKAIGQQLTDKTVYTQLAQLVGTPLYMSPEQAGQSGLDVDTRSDIYSLGVLLYELLTGTTPFDKERFKQAAYDEIRRIIREEDPPKPSTRLSHLSSPHAPREEPGHVTRSVTATLASVAAQRQTEPAKLTRLIRGELDWIVMKALEKDRNRRYETANGFAMDVQRYLADEPVQACPPSAGYRLRKFARRNKAKVAFAAVVLLFLVLLGSGVGYTISERASRQARVGAEVEQILGQTDRLMKQAKWPEALAAAKRAEAALAGGDADDAMQDRVRQIVQDIDLVLRLEDARFRAGEVHEGRLDWAGADRQFSQLFGKFGLDSDNVRPAEAADRLRRPPAVAVELAAALTEWAKIRWRLSEKQHDQRNLALLTLADHLDPDSWRSRLRGYLKQLDQLDESAVLELAASAQIKDLPPATVVMLGQLVAVKVSHDEGAKFLRKAQVFRPEDFGISYYLGLYCNRSRPARNDEAVEFLRAALAVRPTNIPALNLLGGVLRENRKYEEACGYLRRALELDLHYAFAHANLGATLQDQGKLDEAILACRRAIELDSQSASIHVILGLVLAEQTKLEEAIACFGRAIKLNPNYALAHSNLGVFLKRQGKVDEAIAHFRKAIGLEPDYADAHRNLGIALKDLGKVDEAIACYRTAIELDPKSAAHVNLGVALQDEGKLDEAIACYRTAIEFNPKYALAHYNLGIALKDQGKLDEAIAYFKKAIGIDSKNAGFHNNLGMALLRQKKFEQAVVCFQKAIEIDSRNAMFHNNLGTALRDQQRPEDAIACYRTAMDLDPNSAATHNGLGNALRDKKQLDEAIVCYRKAIELRPISAVYHKNLGAALGVQKKHEQAEACFRRAIELDPKYAQAYSDLVIALRVQGREGETIAIRRKLIELQPNDASACNSLAWLLATSKEVKLRRPAEAVALAAQAVKLSPEKWAYWNTFSIACYRVGAWQEALEAREQVIRLNDKDGAFCWNGLSLAMIRWQLGQKDEARTAYERVAEEAKKRSYLEDYLLETQQLLGITPAAPKAEKR